MKTSISSPTGHQFQRRGNGESVAIFQCGAQSRARRGEDYPTGEEFTVHPNSADIFQQPVTNSSAEDPPSTVSTGSTGGAPLNLSALVLRSGDTQLLPIDEYQTHDLLSVSARTNLNGISTIVILFPQTIKSNQERHREYDGPEEGFPLSANSLTCWNFWSKFPRCKRRKKAKKLEKKSC